MVALDHRLLSGGMGRAELAQDGQDGSASGQFKSVVDFVVSISALGGSVIYFGWVRTTALFDYFGLDETLLEFSAQEYLLRSTGVLFRPALYFLGAAVFGLIFLTFINSIVGLLRREALRRWVVLVPNTGVGVVFLSIALLGLNGSVPPLLAAGSLGLGAFILFCSLKIVAAISINSKDHWAHDLNKPASVVTGVTILVALFWASTVYAHQIGWALASSIAQDSKEHSQIVPEVLLYSRFPLHLERQAGVAENELPGPMDAMNYLYTGYRLLIYSNNRWFLIPSTSSGSASNSTLVLIDDGSVRVAICYDKCAQL